jgi:hypothetical protein
MSISWRNRGIIALVKGPPSSNPILTLADPLLAALDDALDCPQLGHLARGDRLALALWWRIERTADEFGMPPKQAADEVAMLCGLAKEMMVSSPDRPHANPKRL